MMMGNYKKEEIDKIYLKAISIGGWLSGKTNKKEFYCSECGKNYEEIGERVARAFLKNGTNIGMCNECGRKYIELGVLDGRQGNRDRQELIDKVLYFKKIRNIEDKTWDELSQLLIEVKKENDEYIKRQRLIKESQPNEEDWKIEQYLIDQYNIYQDKKYLTSEYEIKEHFLENGYYLFECGQGYYEEEVVLIAKIGKRFFEVTVYAEIDASWQDRGGRLYWVESIEKVEYVEIDKPIKKEEVYYDYSIKMKESGKELLEEYFKRKNIEFIKGGSNG